MRQFYYLIQFRTRNLASNLIRFIILTVTARNQSDQDGERKKKKTCSRGPHTAAKSYADLSQF